MNIRKPVLQEASQQVRELQKHNKALMAELERVQRVKDVRIAQLEQASTFLLICLDVVQHHKENPRSAALV